MSEKAWALHLSQSPHVPVHVQDVLYIATSVKFSHTPKTQSHTSNHFGFHQRWAAAARVCVCVTKHMASVVESHAGEVSSFLSKAYLRLPVTIQKKMFKCGSF